MTDDERWTYTDRLATFQGHWDDALTAARQLAAIGHVCDRPPLESLYEGSRCITCSAFVAKDLSVRALGDNASAAASYSKDFDGFRLHHPSCTRLQIRIPLEPQSIFPGLHGGRLADLRAKWEARSEPHRRFEASAPRSSQPQPSSSAPQANNHQQPPTSLFSLPLELRLAIYALVLPSLGRETAIVPLNRDSARVITQTGYERTGPRDTSANNILRVCRATRDEGLEILYARTTFVFAGTKTLFLFLRGIGAPGRALVKEVDVKAGDREDAVAFALLAACGRLGVITIRLPRPVVRFPRAPLWVAEGAACLLALRGLREVRFAPCGSGWKCMDDEKPDAAVIRASLLQPR